MKLSCEVITDLLPSYVDGICSQESKILVEEHLSDCQECSKRLGEMKEPSPLTEVPDFGGIDHMKKLKAHIEGKNLLHLGLLIGLLIVGIAIVFKNYGAVPIELYYCILPVLMASAHLILSDVPVKQGHSKSALGLGALGAFLIGFTLLVEFLLEGWIVRGSYPFGIAAIELGPILYSLFLTVAAVQGILFASGLWLGMKTGYSHLIPISMAVAGSCLSLSFIALIKQLDDITLFAAARNQILLVLLPLGLLSATTLLLLERRRIRPLEE